MKRGIPLTIERLWLMPLSNLESAIILTTLLVNLLDSFTTVTLYLTHTGVEVNPVLRDLLGINPFLAYLYLASFLGVILLFRFNVIVEYGLAIMLFTVHFVASVSNLGVIYYNYSGSHSYIFGGLGVQFLAFLLGVIFIGGSSLYLSIHKKYSRYESIKIIFINYFYYLLAYLIINIMSIIL